MSSALRPNFPAWGQDPQWVNSPQKQQMDQVIQQTENPGKQPIATSNNNVTNQFGIKDINKYLNDYLFKQLPNSAAAALNPLQFEPGKILPRLQQTLEYLAKNPQNVSFTGDMTTVNPGGFSGALNPKFAQSVTPGAPVSTQPSSYSNPNNQSTIEQMGENAGGWQTPGLKAQFDMAMFTKDASTLTKLLPHVPADYAAKFASNISNILGK